MCCQLSFTFILLTTILVQCTYYTYILQSINGVWFVLTSLSLSTFLDTISKCNNLGHQTFQLCFYWKWLRMLENITAKSMLHVCEQQETSSWEPRILDTYHVVNQDVSRDGDGDLLLISLHVRQLNGVRDLFSGDDWWPPEHHHQDLEVNRLEKEPSRLEKLSRTSVSFLSFE